MNKEYIIKQYGHVSVITEISPN